MHDLPVAAITSGWASVYIAVGLAVGGAARFAWDRWRQHVHRLEADAAHEAQAPERELTAAAQAAAAIAAAAAQLIAPFQQTVTAQQGQIGELRAEVRTSRAAEEKCQADLSAVRDELASTKSKLREVTDRLGIDPPNGPTQHPETPC